MANPRGPAERDGDRAATRAPAARQAPTAQAVIGNQLRMPEARCEGGACGARFEDPAALGDGDLRIRAMAAGWREDLAGLLTCPACQQRAPWPDAFRGAPRAAHARPPGQRPAPGQPGIAPPPAPVPPLATAPPPANGRPASYQPGSYPPAAPTPAPGWPVTHQPGHQPMSHQPMSHQPPGHQPVGHYPPGSPPVGNWPAVSWPGSGHPGGDFPDAGFPADGAAVNGIPGNGVRGSDDPDGSQRGDGPPFTEWEAWRAG